MNFHRAIKLPEGKSPFSYGFPMVFQWFSYGFPRVFLWFCSQTYVRSDSDHAGHVNGHADLSTKKATNESYLGFKDAPDMYVYIYI